MCEFVQANLCDVLPKLPLFDLVLLRNVLLYFPQQERSQVLGTVRRQMPSDGYLMLWNAEQAEDSTKLFKVEFASGCYVYRPVDVG
jgi:chemotaxis protein methyltransferase CheR